MAATKGQKIDKVIVTNFSALRAKYGSSGLSAIRTSIGNLINADKKRSLQTIVVGLDDQPTMTKASAPVVRIATDPQQNKDAIDAIYHAFTPDYLMLLGSIDVVPHQDLKNPLYTSPTGDDPDRFALGDLPYACEAAY